MKNKLFLFKSEICNLLENTGFTDDKKFGVAKFGFGILDLLK